MKNLFIYAIIITIVLSITSCKDNSNLPEQSEIYGIWEASYSDIEKNIDSIYFYVELNPDDIEIQGQAIIDVNFINNNNEYINYYRSGQIYGAYVPEFKGVYFNFDDEGKNTKYSFLGEFESKTNSITGNIFIQDTNYKNSDTNYKIPIILIRK